MEFCCRHWRRGKVKTASAFVGAAVPVECCRGCAGALMKPPIAGVFIINGLKERGDAIGNFDAIEIAPFGRSFWFVRRKLAAAFQLAGLPVDHYGNMQRSLDFEGRKQSYENVPPRLDAAVPPRLDAAVLPRLDAAVPPRLDAAVPPRHD